MSFNTFDCILNNRLIIFFVHRSKIMSSVASASSSIMEIDLESISGDRESISGDSNSISSSGFSSTGNSNSVSTNTSRLSRLTGKQSDDGLATKESKSLAKLRFILIAILFWMTVGCALTIWAYFTETQEKEFEDLYIEESHKVLDTIGETFHGTLGAIDSFVLAITAHFVTWPFVTVPNFSIRAGKLREFSKAVVVTSYYFVDEDQRLEWDNYSKANDFWVEDGIEKQENNLVLQETILNKNYSTAEGGGYDYDTPNLTENVSFMPRWQQTPVVPVGSPYNWDGFQYKALANAWDIFRHHETLAVIGYGRNIPTSEDPDLNVEENNQYIALYVGNETSHHTEPFADIFYPIMRNIHDETIHDETTLDSNSSLTNDVVGILSVTFRWSDLLSKYAISEFPEGLMIVVENSCNQTFTYTWSHHKAVYLGSGDLHESAFNHLKQAFSLSDVRESDWHTGEPPSTKGCQYVIDTYPSYIMLEKYHSSKTSPAAYTAIVVIIFLFTSMVFIFYDCLVESRQKTVYSSAVKNSAIVSSLFPKNVRDRLHAQNQAEPAKNPLKVLMSEDDNAKNDAPIADLFLNCTVLFADIAGFTSWSSQRAPAQVFILLETIYGAFDKIADRRGVFKVETIGDCYMAVTGLPNPKKYHALIMARFARDCRYQMNILTKSLEVTLGPDTSNLVMRFGLHSGQVTAGVLRGQKSRFQLFGDTVNTAARMESTGMRNRIHISEDTARLITDGGKDHWLTPREETVEAKGKGQLTTFFVFEKKDRSMSNASTTSSTNSSQVSEGSDLSPTVVNNTDNLSFDRRRRLIDWNVDLFAGSIRKIVARRGPCSTTSMEKGKVNNVGDNNSTGISAISDGMVLDEVVEIIELPAFDPTASTAQIDPQSVHLDEYIMMQLRKYIFTISSRYNENPFHNFEHASHVTMSVAKLLSRIVAPDLKTSATHVNTSSTLHDHTYGITSDPLTQFSCILAALIHDVDHQGVPNTVLIQEEDIIAEKYKGRSVAEQNSVYIAWALFLEPQFNALRNIVCPTKKELDRLRQLVVNTVLATDIMDKDLKQLRNGRWEKAFSSDLKDNEIYQDQINRKATIVLEHLIQASDVCHTMQHWIIYRKWNERLFEEMYHAYLTGRSKADPCTFWYKGELGFFDHYIIPLSKKLSECGVFGVSSDEYLNYALSNRKEWEERGENIVAEMVKRIQAQEAL